MIGRILVAAAVAVSGPAFAAPASAASFAFDQQADYQTDEYGYYYAITGGILPHGATPNGDNASGGTFRRIWDDPYWGGAPNLNTWRKDDWFPENAGLALTMLGVGGGVLYDNNGIEDGTHGGFYDASALADSSQKPGLYRGYNMRNNFDHMYATIFITEEDLEIETIMGYFDENSGFDRNHPFVHYSIDIFSTFLEGETGSGDPIYMPTPVTSFNGDVFSSDASHTCAFSTSDTGVDRVFGTDFGNATDDIFRLRCDLDTPFVLPAGVYAFSHSASLWIPEPSTVTVLGIGIAGLGWLRRRRAA